jgi:hypothetical protein
LLYKPNSLGDIVGIFALGVIDYWFTVYSQAVLGQMCANCWTCALQSFKLFLLFDIHAFDYVCICFAGLYCITCINALFFLQVYFVR